MLRTMDKEKINIYKRKLEGEQERLMQEIASDTNPVDFGNDIEDASEEADEAEEFANRTALAQTKKEALIEIAHALKKIEEGTYGVCDNCKGEIGEEVLLAAPESALCAGCKKKE